MDPKNRTWFLFEGSVTLPEGNNWGILIGGYTIILLDNAIQQTRNNNAHLHIFGAFKSSK